MASGSPLSTSLGALQQKMLTDFKDASALIEHRGAKGRERESLIVRNYLEHYLPRTVCAVHGAEILDSEGRRSAECDIAIQDTSTPPLYLGATFRLIPVEWTHGVIEVKSSLDGEALEDSYDKIQRAKSLRKLTYQIPRGGPRWMLQLYGKQYDYFPMYGAIFAYSGMSLSRIARKIWELQRNTPIETWIDFVVVLNAGTLMYSHPGTSAPAGRPFPGSRLLVVESEIPLIPATLEILAVFNSAFMPLADLGPYVGNEGWGRVIEILGD
jgi:hypothetical protein